MCWDAGEHAGFTTGEPWLPIGHPIEQCNVASQQQDKRSMLWLYRRLIRLRQQEPVPLDGKFEPQRSQREVLLFERRLDCRRLLVALNIGPREQTVRDPGTG
jgi:alpha-glucosidase